jgi:hypothetical protein
MRIGERSAFDEDWGRVGQRGDHGVQLPFARGVEGGGGTKLVGELSQRESIGEQQVDTVRPRGHQCFRCDRTSATYGVVA